MNRKMKIISVSLVLTGILVGSCGSIKVKGHVSRKERTDLAKQYAMTSMLYFALKREGVDLSEKDVSASICVEVGDLPVDLTESIDKMAQSAVDSIKPSQIGDYGNKKPIIIHCVTFMNSKPVADTVRKYLKH